jgi:hypothetical protein
MCINKSWNLCHIIVGTIKVQEIARVTMVLKFNDFCFDLCDNVIAYVKDKGTNLDILINALANIVSSVSLMLP